MKKLIFIILFFLIIMMIFGYISISIINENINLFDWDKYSITVYFIAYPMTSIIMGLVTYFRKY